MHTIILCLFFAGCFLVGSSHFVQSLNSSKPFLESMSVPANDIVRGGNDGAPPLEADDTSEDTLTLRFGPFYGPDIAASFQLILNDLRYSVALCFSICVLPIWVLLNSARIFHPVLMFISLMGMLGNLSLVFWLIMRLRRIRRQGFSLNKSVQAYEVSVAHIQGGDLQTGDKILTLNGVSVEQIPSNTIERLLRAPGQIVSLTVRGGSDANLRKCSIQT